MDIRTLACTHSMILGRVASRPRSQTLTCARILVHQVQLLRTQDARRVDRTTPKHRPTESDYQSFSETQQHPSSRSITRMQMYSPSHSTMPSGSPQGRPRGGGRRHGSSRRRLVHGRLAFFLRLKDWKGTLLRFAEAAPDGWVGQGTLVPNAQDLPDKLLWRCNQNRNAMRRGSVTQHGDTRPGQFDALLKRPLSPEGFPQNDRLLNIPRTICETFPSCSSDTPS